MIFCRKEFLNRYLGLDRNLDEAIRYVLALDADGLEPGRVEIRGNEIYLNRQSLTTAPEEGLLFESHRRYIDIHLGLSGTERILCAEENTLEPVEKDEEKDYIFLKGRPRCEFSVTAGDALVLFPYEGHKVKCMTGSPEQVEKIIVKIRPAGRG